MTSNHQFFKVIALLLLVYTCTATNGIKIVNLACTARLNGTEISGHWEQPPPTVLLPDGRAQVSFNADTGMIRYSFKECRQQAPVTIRWSLVSPFKVSCEPRCSIAFRSPYGFLAHIKE
ncbi:hypothetical protein P9112_010494 [Eukaryota sp. TZLM1-RC]